MPKGSFFGRWFLLYTVLTQQVYAAVPYIPSQIFFSAQQNNTIAYILQPKSSKGIEVQFLSKNISQIDLKNPEYTVLTDTVPFQRRLESDAFIPMVNPAGNTMIFSGNCQGSDDTGVVWSFNPDEHSSTGNGTWSSFSINVSTKTENDKQPGPGYLAGGVAYTSSNNTSSLLFTFGGMCPFMNSSQENWISSARYSRTMTVLTPSDSQKPVTYTLEPNDSSNPPVAEAGFTITPLQGTSSTTPAGRILQQGDFIFIGGHTQNAFINMSSLALFSLPQASWTYIPVTSSADLSRTNLALRGAQIEPRSGHSAVLSSDGSKIIVFGGWVGDTNIPAEPQLLILEIGEDYGGSGEWAWTVPPQTIGSDSPQGSGIFGHAAAILPGDVMMITGGYSTPSSSSKRTPSGFELNSQVYLYNVTSNSWMPSYTTSAVQDPEASQSTTGRLSSIGEKAGLGVGLSAAAAAVLGVGYCLWSRKRSRHRRFREQELRKLALGAERSHIWDEPGMAASFQGSMTQQRVLGIQASVIDNAYPWAVSRRQGSRSSSPQHRGSEAEKTGLLLEVPNPTRGLRKSLSTRPQRVQSAGWYDDPRMNYNAGIIHPIDECDEYETPPESAQKGDAQQHCNGPEMVDPFADPSSARNSRIIDEQALQQEDDYNCIDSTSAGGSQRSRSASLTKTDRTHSNLSESSASALSMSSTQCLNFSSVKRTDSHRAGTHLYQVGIPILELSSSANSTVTRRGSPQNESPQPDHYQGQLLSSSEDTVIPPFERTITADSFSTAPTSQKQSQLEGESLLGSGPEWATPPESPTKVLLTGPKRSSLSWVGSVRRTLKKAANLDMFLAPSPDDPTITAPMSTQGPETRMPRRTVSASAAHLRRKQGPRDWAVDKRASGDGFISYSPSEMYAPGEHEDNENDGFDEDGDWDVEAAAEGRTVQVTYTIPKEKLRVVNAGVGDRVLGDDESDRVSRRSMDRS